MLGDLTPAVFALEETKRKINEPPMKCNNISNYQVFELRREKEKDEGGKGLEGGGIALGVLHELKPVLTRQGDDDIECLSVIVKTMAMNILCVVGYGPQLGDPITRKTSFWTYLSQEVKTANDKNIGLIIQIDSNAWVGEEVIPGDPNKQNRNGILMQNFLQNNPALTVVNALPCCEGLITRRRQTIVGYEKSILDVFIVCRKILPLIKHMKVDHEGKFTLTNFNAKKRIQRTINSDHHPIILTLDLSIPTHQPKRETHFNFKDPEGQVKFFNMTDQNSKLTEIFSSNKTFEKQIIQWEKNVKSVFHQTFSKVRQKKRKFREDEVGFIIEQINKIKMKPTNPENEKDIEILENKIIEKTEESFAKRIKEALGNFTGEDGGINHYGMWKEMEKVNPNRKKQPQIPTALKDKKGNLITNQETIKEFALTAIVQRLRKRPIHPELTNMEKMKLKLSKIRLKKARNRKTPNWNMKEMNKAIQSMKNKKCRDAQGLINELLKPGIAGRDFKTSLLLLLNKTKKHLKIPHMMKLVNIALIPKPGKRNLQDIENHRGIFLIHKYRSLLMKMILNDKYAIIDEFMSDSNVGGRRGRSIRDHLFIVNGIIHDHVKTNNPITFQILDYRLCFDSMWFEEVGNDLYSAGFKDDKLALLMKLNEVNEIALQTPSGLSKRTTVKNIICQGDCWGCLECSLMIDNFGKDSLKPELEPYKYKNKVPIPLLGMVDDTFLISESGYKAQRLNGFINAKTATKKLQFGADKCHIMHIGKDIPKHKKDNFYVDSWLMEEVEDVETNTKETREMFDGEMEIEESDHKKYLGQIISHDGTNTKNIVNRASKGRGTVNKIETILKNTLGGTFFFEISIILRNSLLISSMLSGSETWYNMKETDYRKLEQTDEILLKKILKCSNQVAFEMLYLDLGIMPIRHIIMLRRITYFQQILHQRVEYTLLYQFFEAQLKNPTTNDWVTQVLRELDMLEINFEINEIEQMTKEEFSKICKLKVRNNAFDYLLRKKNKSDIRRHIEYTHLRMASYLEDKELGLSVKERQYLFQCRTNDIDVKANRPWKYDDLICISCRNTNTNTNTIESQIHILHCETLVRNNNKISYLPTYGDLYSEDVQEQIYISNIIFENMRIRQEFQQPLAQVN